LLYAISMAPAERRKAEVANAIIDEGEIAVCVQVLQEFYVQATRPSRTDRLTADQASRLMEAFGRFPTVESTVDLMRAAMRTSERFNISYWDAAVVEAARAGGCSTLLSEDLTHGQDYGGVRVENPFLQS
jgi:predicted nucleic acid-binding protein